MRNKPVASLKQKAAMAPRLYQSLRILRMNAAELSEYIRKEIADNPALRIPEPGEFSEVESVPLETMPANSSTRGLWFDLESSEPKRHGAAPTGGLGYSLNPAETAASPVTLADHLSLQLDMLNLPAPGRSIGKAILGSLDDHGYLRESVEEIAHITSSEPAQVEEVLSRVQDFDPPGVAARSLEECLCLQIKQLGAGETARQIADGYLDQVAHGAYSSISRQLSVPVREVMEAVELIRSLNPAPGDSFDVKPPPGAAIPDVFASVEGGRVRTLSSRQSMPHLKLSSLYRQIASGEKQVDSETADYARSMIDKASELVSDVDKRRSTLTRVAREIARAQKDFFEKGPLYLKPLSLDEVAARLNLHPSTISRAILGKYMSTPYGVFEFRYFFSGGYEVGGREVSSTAVKKKLELLIAGENRGKPLSDQRLSTLLRDEGVSISRRTVAKYREALHIPPSRERKSSPRKRQTGKKAAS